MLILNGRDGCKQGCEVSGGNGSYKEGMEGVWRGWDKGKK